MSIWKPIFILAYFFNSNKNVPLKFVPYCHYWEHVEEHFENFGNLKEHHGDTTRAFWEYQNHKNQNQFKINF